MAKLSINLKLFVKVITHINCDNLTFIGILYKFWFVSRIVWGRNPSLCRYKGGDKLRFEEKAEAPRSFRFWSDLFLNAFIFVVKAVVGAGAFFAVTKAFDVILVDVDRADVGVGVFVVIVEFTAFAGAEGLVFYGVLFVHSHPSLSFSIIFVFVKKVKRKRLYILRKVW